MKGSVIIPRKGRDFEVAHRIEDGEHHIEVWVGSSFNELYWDFSARSYVADPPSYESLPAVLRTFGADWLLEVIPQLARGAALTSADLAKVADPNAPIPPTRDEVIAASDRAFFESLGPVRPGIACRREGCPRGAVAYSVLCAAHHFESVQGRPWHGDL